ncbi:hypothetical protein WICPIJ_002556 [Wickerhamomyces pijperi]|uniref:Uncharacterized protein n=1 Tax=Wickerhamomyces pijperi TaxID=599730 RepID=A0A9P8QBM4_WICPI|nr:hypothetical protein WICPIJ_002556 [Wickerhamomyces pijperi]
MHLIILDPWILALPENDMGILDIEPADVPALALVAVAYFARCEDVVLMLDLCSAVVVAVVRRMDSVEACSLSVEPSAVAAAAAVAAADVVVAVVEQVSALSGPVASFSVD